MKYAVLNDAGSVVNIAESAINFKKVRFVLIIVHKMARNESKHMLSV